MCFLNREEKDMSKDKATIRNSNIELLRICAALGVIILHYNNENMGGGFRYVDMQSINSYLMYFFENVAICAVNVFVLISGFFMSKKREVNTSKAVELIVQVIVFNAATLMLRLLANGFALSWKECLVTLLPLNYYVTLYIVVFLLSPYINSFLSGLKDSIFKKLVLILVVLFSVWPTILDVMSLVLESDFGGMNTIGINGSQNGYTIVNFMLMYIIGAYLKRCIYPKKAINYLWRLCICWGIQFMCSYIAAMVGVGLDIVWAYCNPMVILTAIYTFLFFYNLKEIKSKVINSLAKAAFTVYLLHMLFVGRIAIERFVNSSPLIYLLHVTLSCICIYLICYIVYLFYNYIISRVFGYLEKFIKFPVISCGDNK